ncbi:MAG: ABC-type transport auxiliary lipoprotein family protein [Pseudomonadota bacterium]
MRHLFSLLLLFALAACGGSETLVATPQVKLAEHGKSKFSDIEVIDVSLPVYAASEAIAIVTEDGLTRSSLLWADDPTRAVTLALTRNLKEITGARIASEPWPFDSFPKARIDVRVEALLVSETALTFSGQYFVADLEGRGRDHAHLFEIITKMPDLSASAAARGRAEAVAILAQRIAKEAL